MATQLYIVDGSSVHQQSRIKHHLIQYRDKFLNLGYIDGTGYKVSSAYDIWINLCLITSKVRPAFMVQWVDYLDHRVFEYIMGLLTNYRDGISLEDVDYRLLFITDPQGVIVTTYYSYYKNKLREDYSDYFASSYDNLLLGIILGYPAAGEIELQPEDMKYFNNNKQPPGRYMFSIYGSVRGSGQQQIMGNIYRTSQSRNKLYEFYKHIVDVMKVYDPNAIIVVSDSQGSLLSPEFTYVRTTPESVNVTKEMQQSYDNYIENPERKRTNWNTDFDSIFEIGYMYHQ